MLTADQIVAIAQRKWPDVLRAEVVGQENLFPLHVRFGRPSTTGDIGQISVATNALATQARGWRIEWEDVDTRKWGRQRWPSRVVFDSIEDVASALGRSTELEQVRSAVRDARQKVPALESWLRSNAHRIAEHLPYWEHLIAVCAYFDEQPRPNCYARQIHAAPDTKFIEQREPILRELLDATLGERANCAADVFAERFHLRVDAPQVRFRFLDDTLRIQTGWPVNDCSVSLPAFASLTWRVPRVLIVENRTVFLCVPQIDSAIVIWGAGKAAAMLESCAWLRNADVRYWGDCDEAGYGILSALRRQFPHVRSVLMDNDAWTRWKRFAVPGKRDPSAARAHLDARERAALEEVIAGPWMLEQERIPPAEADVFLIHGFET